ncbi:hypothetical protein L249_0257 [Ophiocordyceps polyrhachis-furcata BCC 54312]|uniref:Uncharacterized protein n=1 Tax=Ophiocordyceps polyrhachis-furcata BCC 54312 TaxID=1330021 RepID=A0A367LCZ0_9HYPO|nr:hypothetical protein L249_0257 [Ophiocordyceps polyrhachis-furcata BCC 54312]
MCSSVRQPQVADFVLHASLDTYIRGKIAGEMMGRTFVHTTTHVRLSPPSPRLRQQQPPSHSSPLYRYMRGNFFLSFFPLLCPINHHPGDWLSAPPKRTMAVPRYMVVAHGATILYPGQRPAIAWLMFGICRRLRVTLDPRSSSSVNVGFRIALRTGTALWPSSPFFFILPSPPFALSAFCTQMFLTADDGKVCRSRVVSRGTRANRMPTREQSRITNKVPGKQEQLEIGERTMPTYPVESWRDNRCTTLPPVLKSMRDPSNKKHLIVAPCTPRFGVSLPHSSSAIPTMTAMPLPSLDGKYMGGGESNFNREDPGRFQVPGMLGIIRPPWYVVVPEKRFTVRIAENSPRKKQISLRLAFSLDPSNSLPSPQKTELPAHETTGPRKKSDSSSPSCRRGRHHPRDHGQGPKTLTIPAVTGSGSRALYPLLPPPPPHLSAFGLGPLSYPPPPPPARLSVSAEWEREEERDFENNSYTTSQVEVDRSTREHIIEATMEADDGRGRSLVGESVRPLAEFSGHRVSRNDDPMKTRMYQPCACEAGGGLWRQAPGSLIGV